MQKIAVCGDSYMTPVVNPAGSHFAELLAKKFDAELLYYSRGGMSNAGICIQLQDAIRSKPDLILLDTTFYDRTEFSIAKKSQRDFHVTDIVYAHREAVSTYQPWLNQNPTLIVDNLKSLLKLPESPARWNDLYVNTPGFAEKVEALKHYLVYLYDPAWKWQIDTWCMYAGLHQLETSGIPYLIVLDPLQIKHFPWITEKNYMPPSIDSFYSDADFWKSDKDPGYHTTPEAQEQICQKILNHLKKWNFINE